MDIRSSSIFGYLSKYKGTEVDAAVERVQGLDAEFALKVDKTTKINGIPLQSDINLTYADVGALSKDTRYGALMHYDEGVLSLLDTEGRTLDTVVLGTGARILNELWDVRIGEPTNNQVLTYDSTREEWINQSVKWGTITGTLADQTDLKDKFDIIEGNISTEAGARQSADNNLQEQIDAITAASDVSDIVGTYAELLLYDTSTLQNNNIIKVLQDETHGDQVSYYRWIIATPEPTPEVPDPQPVGTWNYIGGEGPYYTKSDANSTFVAQTTTINNKALSSDITLTATDVGALPSSTKYGASLTFNSEDKELQLLDQNGDNIGNPVGIRVQVDNVTVSENEDGELQAIGLIDQNDGGHLPVWSGTMEEYEELEALDLIQDNVIYHTTDDADTEAYARITRNIGEIVVSTVPLNDAGLHLLDGSLIEEGIYQDFVEYMARLYKSKPMYAWECEYEGVTQTVYTKTLNIIDSTQLYNSDNTEYTGNNFVIVDTPSGYAIKYSYPGIENWYAWQVQPNQPNVGYPTTDVFYTKSLDTLSQLAYSLPNETLESYEFYRTYDAETTIYTNILRRIATGIEAECDRVPASDTTTPITRYIDTEHVVSDDFYLPVSYFTTETAWQTSNRTYGVCGKFVYMPSITYYAWTYNDYSCFTLTPEPTSVDVVYTLDEDGVQTEWEGCITSADASAIVSNWDFESDVSGTVTYTRDTEADFTTGEGIRLPKITGFIEGITDYSELGNVVAQGLPNHTHTRGTMEITGSFNQECDRWTLRGAFYQIGYDSLGGGVGNDGSRDGEVGFAASRTWSGSTSNPEYPSGVNVHSTTKVQPQSTKVLYYITIATYPKMELAVDIDNIATDLNGKAGVDLTNINNTGKIAIAHNVMPSNIYDDLTLGASGTYYTAPADGYFVIAKTPTANGQSLYFYNHTTHFGLGGTCYGTSLERRIFPAKKNDEVEVGYTLAGATSHFRFYYAVGSESEAS